MSNNNKSNNNDKDINEMAPRRRHRSDMSDYSINFLKQKLINELTPQKDFFEEYMNWLYNPFFGAGGGILYGTFLLKDSVNTLNLSTGQAEPLLPKISIPLHFSWFNYLNREKPKYLNREKKKKLIGILERAYANIPFADYIVFPTTSKNSENYVSETTYMPELVVFILDCYMKAVVHCLSSSKEKLNPNDFALEKTVFGDSYQQYICEESGKAFSEKISSQFSFTNLQKKQDYSEYVIISKKQDVSYQEIYDLFHCHSFFPVLAFLALYKSLEKKDKLTEMLVYGELPYPYYVSVRYKPPFVEFPISVTAVCVLEKYYCSKRDVLAHVMQRIVDSYLYNKKKMREELNFRLRYEDRKRGCIEELHQRAIQHDIDSHVLSKYVSEQALEQIDINNLKNYTPLQEEETPPSKFALLARLNQFRTQLSAYCTDLHAGAPLSRSVITIRSLLASLDQNRLLMNDVSGAGSSFQYRLKIFFDNEQEPAEMSDKRFDQQIFIPNGQLGCQAFYMIVNNVIRNTAKHVKRTNTQNEVSICIRFLEKIRPTYTLRPSEKDKNISEVVAHYAQNSMVYGEIERKLYTVEIFSNVIQENITNLVRNQNERICEPFVNKETLEKRTTNKGLGEMLCAATYLRGKDVVTANEEENIPNWENFDSIEHINILNQNEEPVMLKAFGLIPLNSCDIITKSWSQFDPEQMVLTPSGMIVNGHQVADSENNRHTCYSWDEVDEMDGIANSYNGFLGYRFFMLKPEQVLVVRDDNSNISNNKAEEVAKHVGVNVVSSKELRNQLEKGVPVNHDILVCDDKELIGEYSAMLPARILPISDIQDFTEPSEDKTGGGSEGNDKPDPFVIHCWEKWVEKLNPIIKSYNTSVNNENDVAYFDDHLNRGIGLFLTALEKAGYADALSSVAQQHLPDYERNCRNDYGEIRLSCYFYNIREKQGIAHYRLLESINTRVLIVDERIQQKSQDIPSLGGDSKITYQCHWKKCHIDLPDVILSESSKEETAKKILNIIDEALEKTYYHFIFIQLGLLEGVFSTLYPTDMNKVCLHKKMEEIAAKGKGRVVFESGRGVPDYLPVRARFMQQTSAEYALVETKSKYLFASLLHNSRAVSPESGRTMPLQ